MAERVERAGRAARAAPAPARSPAAVAAAAGSAAAGGGEGLNEVLRALVRRNLADAEVLVKRGRSRRLVMALGGGTSVASQERAWAVRASGRRASLFVAGTGEPPGGGGPGAAGWPEPAGRPFRLPAPERAPAWSEPSDFAAPLIGESEGLQLLAGLERELAAELPGARLVHAALEDGSSESDLVNSRGLAVHWRRRLATLHLEAAGPAAGRAGAPAAGAASAAIYVAAREARHFHPAALARRLADRLALAAAGGAPALPAAGGAMLLAPPVAIALLAELLPLLVGPAAAGRVAALRDRRGRIGSDCVTLLDNGRLPGGALESPVDGEGMPCGEAVLVQDGIYRQPLLAWWQADGAAPGSATGCCRRPSWRDLPVPGPTHLYLRPDPRVAVGALLAEVRSGAYLVETTGGVRYDAAAERFAAPVCGFVVEGGRAAAPLPAAWLCGSATALLRGIAGVGRDLTFLPRDGMIGTPTLLVGGLELHPAGAPRH